jgi:hypothetical protein
VPGTQSYRTSLCEATTSGLPPIADVSGMCLNVRLVPESDVTPLAAHDVAQSFLNCATTRSARIGTQYLAKNAWCSGDSAYLR